MLRHENPPSAPEVLCSGALLAHDLLPLAIQPPSFFLHKRDLLFVIVSPSVVDQDDHSAISVHFFKWSHRTSDATHARVRYKTYVSVRRNISSSRV